MSFILDALKKSERERARSEQPSTLELPRGKQRRVTPVWMVIVLLLLVLNCGLLVYMMMRKSSSVQTTVPAASEVSTPTSTAPPAGVVRKSRPVRSLEEEAGIAAAPADEDSADAGAVDDESTVRSPSPHASIPSTSTTSHMVTALPANTATPTMESLGGPTALGLPELRLDLHVYGNDAKERMVFINGETVRGEHSEYAMLQQLADERCLPPQRRGALLPAGRTAGARARAVRSAPQGLPRLSA